MSEFVAVGEVLLCKGYADNKDEEHLKELWIREHMQEVMKFVKVEVLHGDEKKDVLVGGIFV
jgi:hypothetical protein